MDVGKSGMVAGVGVCYTAGLAPWSGYPRCSGSASPPMGEEELRRKPFGSGVACERRFLLGGVVSEILVLSIVAVVLSG